MAIFALVIIVATVTALRPAARPQPLTFDRLRAGECLTGPNLIESLQDHAPWPAKPSQVECTRSHVAEVVRSGVGWVGFTNYPGAGTVSTEGSEACRDALTTYAGTSKAPAGFSVDALVPDAPNWAAGNRQLVCVAYPDSSSGVDYSIRGQAS
jgi:Septum formation